MYNMLYMYVFVKSEVRHGDDESLRFDNPVGTGVSCYALVSLR